jgi:hypothetical protein
MKEAGPRYAVALLNIKGTLRRHRSQQLHSITSQPWASGRELTMNYLPKIWISPKSPKKLAKE